jgi:hypothetical protein
MPKLLNLSENWALVFCGNQYEKTNNSGKVAEFYFLKIEIAVNFFQIAVNFCSVGGEADSRPGNTT